MSSFWDFERRDEQTRADAEAFGRLGRRQAWNRMARFSIRSRGMDPDLVPSLSMGLNMESTVAAQPDRDLSARAQASGVSVEQYRAATPKQREALASWRGSEYQRRQSLRDQGFDDKQMQAMRRIQPFYLERLEHELDWREKSTGVRPTRDTQAYTQAQEGAEATVESQMSDDYRLIQAASQGEQDIGAQLWESTLKILGGVGSVFGWIEEQDPILAGPLARTAEEGFPYTDPEGRTGFERGAEISRPVAKPMLAGIAEPFEQAELGVEAVTGIPAEGTVSGKITGDVAEDILTEVINPAAIVLVAPLVGQGIRLSTMSARMVAAKMVSNLLGTGMEPELIRGALRGMSRGQTAIKASRAVKGAAATETLGGFTRAPRTKPLRGGPPPPALVEYQRHADEMATVVDRSEKWTKQVKVEAAEGRATPRMVDEASTALSDSRASLRTAKNDLETARFRNAREEVVEVVKATGADDVTVRMLGDAFDHSVARVPGQEVLMTVGATRHRLAQAAAHITGTPPGVVGRLAHHRDILLSAMRRYSKEAVHPVFEDLQKSLKTELDNIKFTGPKKWTELAEGQYKTHHVVQHPEWYEGMSPTLRIKLDKAQELMRVRLETAKALGYPIEALDKAYLEQLWEIPSQAIGSAYMPGRVSVAKPKLFDDYFTGLTQGYTPLPMSVEELMQHSTGLLDQAVADAWMKQEIVRRFGTKHRGKVIAGKTRFNHVLYKDWWGPTEISSWLDEMEAPIGRRLRQVSNVSAAFRGTVFGLTDIAVAGVQFPLSLAHGGFQVGVGSLNRSLQMLGLPYMHLYLQDTEFLGRCVQAAADGLHIGTGPSSVQLRGGTVAKYIPGLKQVVEPTLNKAIDFATQVQFGHALSSVRLRMFEGNLMTLKLTGKDITQKAVRQLAAEWANSATGASRGPMVKGRRAVEAIALTSVQMTRANLSVYGQLAKTVAAIPTGKVSKMEGLRAVMTLANIGAYTYGTQYLFNEVLGDGPMQWIPGRSDWATIRIGGLTVPIIPQRSILRAIDKSVKILAEEVGLTDTDRYKPQDLLAAWSQVAVGKASPLAGIVPGAAGYGFEPGTGKFEMGGLSAEGRIVGALPVPPLLEQAGWQERDELALAIAGLGFNPYDTSSGILLREEFKTKTGNELNWESPAHREVIDKDTRLSSLWEKSRAESREYGSEAAITSEEIRQEIAEGEETKGVVRLAEAVLSGDPFAMTNWREARSEFLIWRSGTWNEKLTGKEPKTEIGKLVTAYYDINPKAPEFTDPDGETDWGAFMEAREAVLVQMSQADRDAIKNNEKFTNDKAEKVDKQFREAQERLRPFWDLEAEVWSRLRVAYDVLRPYASVKELEKAKAAELVKLGYPQEEVQWRLNRVPIISDVRGVISQARFNYRLEHPEVDALLVKWYGNTPAAQQVKVGTGKFRPGRGLVAGKGLGR